LISRPKSIGGSYIFIVKTVQSGKSLDLVIAV
jgi:hypothetical protein